MIRRSFGTTRFRPTNFILNIAEIVISSCPTLTRAYYELHRARVRVEIQHADIHPETRLVFIGGGPVPHSAIRIAAETGASVDVVDSWPLGARLAQRTVQRMGMESRVRVVNGDGLTIRLDEYQVIFLAIHITPKDEVISRIIRDANKGSVVIFRNPAMLRGRLLENFTEPKTLPNCVIKEIQDARLWPFRTYIAHI